jgi:hypothetical protein
MILLRNRDQALTLVIRGILIGESANVDIDSRRSEGDRVIGERML